MCRAHEAGRRGHVPLDSQKAEQADETAASWRRLYRNHFQDVYRIVYCMGVAHADLEDVTQRVFMVVHSKLDKDRPIENPRAWLRAITLRVVSDYRRWHKVRKVKQWLVRATYGVKPDLEQTPEDGAAAGQVQREVREVVSQMSPKLQDVLVLADLEGATVREVAETLGVPVNTVRSRIRLAREQFAKLWKQR